MTGNYDVGYGKPPKATQFVKGKSGNPKGRPKGSKNFHGILVSEAMRMVTIQENGKPRRITLLAAAVRGNLAKAAKGDPRALKLMYDLLDAGSRKGLADTSMFMTQSSFVWTEEDAKVERYLQDTVFDPPKPSAMPPVDERPF